MLPSSKNTFGTTNLGVVPNTCSYCAQGDRRKVQLLPCPILDPRSEVSVVRALVLERL